MTAPGQRLFSVPAVSSLVALASLAAYAATVAPGVSFIDSGELATVASRLGVAHPTGYPLFTLLGALWSRIPLGAEAIVRLNVMAAVLCAGAAALFAAVIASLLQTAARQWPQAGLSTMQRLALTTSATAGAALLLAFSGTFWSQATSIEVYSLHLLLLSGIMFAVTRGATAEREGALSAQPWWITAAFLAGLGFANHMTTILLVPGLLFWFFTIRREWRHSVTILLRTLPAFVLGLTPYLYLPIRAAQNPIPNWGYPATLERLLWHVSGKQYRVWIFSSPEVAWRQLRYFVETLPGEFGTVGLLLAGAGMVALFRTDRKLFWSAAILFATCVLYAINYDIHDIDSYFLLAYWCTALWIAFGLLWTGWWLARRAGRASMIVPPALLVPAVALLMHNAPRLDSSQEYAVEDYTKNMFSSLDSNAVVLSYQWDYWVSASYYCQLVRNERPDVAVIDKELLRRSWYIRELRARHPRLMETVPKEVDAFLIELDKFEQNRPYSPAVIQARFEQMINTILARNMAVRPLYVTGEIEPEFTRGFQRVPSGLAFRLFADSLFHEIPPPEFTFREIAETSKMHGLLKKMYADAALAWGQYRFSGTKKPEFLKKAAELALSYDPSHPVARELKSRLAR